MTGRKYVEDARRSSRGRVRGSLDLSRSSSVLACRPTPHGGPKGEEQPEEAATGQKVDLKLCVEGLERCWEQETRQAFRETKSGRLRR